MKKYKPAPGTGRLIYSRDIVADLGISDRTLRKWMRDGRFPRPSGNLHGRHFWSLSSYHSWVTAAVAGRFSRTRYPTNVIRLPSSRTSVRATGRPT